MNYKLLFFVTALFLLHGCKKTEDENPVQHPAAWANANGLKPEIWNLLEDMAPLPQSFAIDPAFTNDLLTANGVNFKIIKNSFVNDAGILITSPVTVTVFEYNKNSELLTGNVSTGKERDDHIMSVNGAFVIYANGKLGEVLHTQLPITVTRATHSFDPVNDKIFSGTEQAWSIKSFNPITWRDEALTFTNVGTGYHFPLTQLGWCSVGQDILANGTPGATLDVKLPAGFGNQNSMVFVLFPEVGFLQLQGQPRIETFTTSYQVPAGKQFKLLSIGYKDKQFYFNLQQSSATGKQLVTVDSMSAIGKTDLQRVIQTQLD